MEDIDEFEAFKAMAFNRNRRGSQSVPSTPQIPTRNYFQFTRELSRSERRRRSARRRNGCRHHSQQPSQQQQQQSSHISEQDMQQMCNSVSGEVDLTDRLSRLSMTEIWVRRLRMQRNSSSDYDDDYPAYPASANHANTLYPDSYTNGHVIYGYPGSDDVYHEPLDMRRSNPEHRSTYADHVTKIDHRRSLSCRDRTKHLREQHSSDIIRPRTSSMPSKGNVKRPNTLSVNAAGDGATDQSPRENAEEYYILRTFSTSKKGLINRGDSFKRRKTPSTAAESDGGGGGGGGTVAALSAGTASSVGSVHSSVVSQPPVYRVLLLGASGVGKTTLLQQFTSSDYMANGHSDAYADYGT